jgi:hypothetical protein
MAQLQFTAVSPPLDTPGVGTLAARLLNFAATMDLVPSLPPAVTLDYQLLLDGAKKVVTATGAGGTTLVRLLEQGAQEPSRLRDLLADLYQELESSPAPQVEWGPVQALLGQALLADLLRVSTSSIDRYEANERPTPDLVADRLHFLALTVSDLAGAYNAFGIRRWFDRPRKALNGESPRNRLASEWTSDSEGANQVKNLASSLTSSPAT